MVLAESPTALGQAASHIVQQQQPDGVILVGGTAALSDAMAAELKRIVPGVDLERLAGTDRIHTAALAASRILRDGQQLQHVVLANGWSLSDVGTAASAVAAGRSDLVLYTGRGTLGEPTRGFLAEQQPTELLIVGGPAAVSDDVAAHAQQAAGSAQPPVRLGGTTRIETAALSAGEAFADGADTAVIANGWSLPDVGIAAALAAAHDRSAVVYAERGRLGATAESLIGQHQPATIVPVDTIGTDVQAITARLAQLAPQSSVKHIDSAASAAHHALGTTPPPTTQNASVKSIASGSGDTCAVNSDKSITCWDKLGYQLGNVPDGQFDSIALGTGGHHCAIGTDQSIVCWATFGPVGAAVLDPPSGSFTAIELVWSYACALRTSGTATCWGSTPEERTPLPRFPADVKFSDIEISSQGDWNSSLTLFLRPVCGVLTTGAVACWNTKPDGTPVQMSSPSGRFVEIEKATSATRKSFCGIRVDGTIACWVPQIDGEPPLANIQDPLPGPPAGRFASIAAGAHHYCGLRADGSVTCWGDNFHGQTQAPTGTFLAISAGSDFSCGLRGSDDIECWGANFGPDGGAPDGKFTAIDIRDNTACAVRTDGSVYCWGDLTGWGTIDGDRAQAPDGKYTSVSVGGGINNLPYACAIRAEQSISCWGSAGQFLGTRAHPDDDRLTAATGTFADLHTGDVYACALRTKGAIACWGDKFEGQTGPPSGTFTSIAGWAESPGNFIGPASTIHYCALATNGEIACWGSNDWAETDPPDGPFTAIALSAASGCALRTEGSIACWGDTTWPQPEPQPRRRTFTSIASSDSSDYCALAANGEIACWGDNAWAETDLPDGPFTAVALGWSFGCALRADGSIACWGGLPHQRWGDPEDVYGISNTPSGRFTAVAAGSDFACALDTDGAVSCWGQRPPRRWSSRTEGSGRW